MEQKNYKRTTVTAALPYANGGVHIGHLAGVYVPADIYVRYLRLKNREVVFIGGSDEHGVPVTIRAKQEGITVQQVVDRYHEMIKKSFEEFGISFDIYSRTTSEIHHKFAADFFRTLYDKGELEEITEEQYCDEVTGEFLTDRNIVGECPRCHAQGAYGDQCEKCGATLSPDELINPTNKNNPGHGLVKRPTKNWYLPLNKYQEWLKKWILEGHKEWRSNVYGQCKSWLDMDLQPRAMTRDLDWGIPVPGDEKHVIYVWFDALSNYLTPIGFLDNPEKFAKYWPANLHLVGKEIVRFHTVIWPAILMALDLPLPKMVYGHGWLVVEGDKMSKSKGNVIDPLGLIEEFSADAIRYFLLREINLGQDGNFSRDALITRINADLANDLGNLLHRSLSMIGKFQGGKVFRSDARADIDDDLIADALGAAREFKEHMDKVEISAAIKRVWSFISHANKYIDLAAPWKLAKEEESKERLSAVLYNLAESLRFIAVLISPYMPSSAQRIWQQLNLPQDFAQVGLDALDAWGGIEDGLTVGTPEQLFPRIEVEKEQRVAGKKQKKVKA